MISVLAEDNGRGFDVMSRTIGNGFGLTSLQSRMEYLDGILDIDSHQGEGTTISVQVPIS